MGTGQKVEKDSARPHRQPWEASTEHAGNEWRGVLRPLCQELDVRDAEEEWAA